MSENRYRSKRMGNDRASQIQTHLANLSTEELEDRLAELIMDESDDNNTLIEAYLAELDKRDPCKPIITAEESLRNFHRKHPMIFAAAKNTPTPRRTLRPARFLLTAIVVVTVFGLLAAQVSGVNVFHVFARWTNETFGLVFFDSADAPPEANYACSELQAALDGFEISASLVPTYLPEGYNQIELYSNDTGSLFIANYQSGENYISIRIKTIDRKIGNRVQMDGDPPEIYVINEVEHNIMTNMGKYSAAWENSGFECNISNVSSKEILYDILDSIY